MYIDDGITIDEIDARSGTLTVGKINSRIDGTKKRSIIHFTKYTFASGFDDLDIDIKLRCFPSKRTHHRFPMKLGMLMLEDKEILKT